MSDLASSYRLLHQIANDLAQAFLFFLILRKLSYCLYIVIALCAMIHTDTAALLAGKTAVD